MFTSIPRGIMQANRQATLGTYSALLRGTVDFWSGAAKRGATPFDLWCDYMKWVGTSQRRVRPQWAHESTVLVEWQHARLRDFSAADAPAGQVATLFLPPQAGHDSCIVDYAPGQSQVMAAREAGLGRVASMDWIGATQETKDTSIDDYIDVIHQSTQLLGGKVNLVGDCQGGWLAVIYAAMYPETINTLTIAGAPIDYHAGEPLIHDYLQVLTPGDDMSFYRSVVDFHGGVLPGDFLLGGFIGMQPHNEVARQTQLLANINDDEYVDRYTLFETWFQWTQPLPGSFYLWVVEHLFKNNELIKGELEVGGRLVDLADIDCPLFLLAGATDHITPREQVWALGQYTSTPEDQIDYRLAPGGHLGLFMGHESLKNHWAPTFVEIAAISGPSKK